VCVCVYAHACTQSKHECITDSYYLPTMYVTSVTHHGYPNLQAFSLQDNLATIKRLV
jgi:hypothetical protein